MVRKKKLNSIPQKYYKISAFLTTGVQTLQNSSHDRAGDRISDWSSSQAAVGVPLPHAAVSAFVAIDLTKDNILVRILLKHISSARFYLNFPTGKLFGKLSFLQNFSGGAHSALKHRYITLQPKEIILELSGSKILWFDVQNHQSKS